MDKHNPAEIKFGVLENSDLGTCSNRAAIPKKRNHIALNSRTCSRCRAAARIPGGKYDMVLIHQRNLKNLASLKRESRTYRHLESFEEPSLCKKQDCSLKTCTTNAFTSSQ